MTQEKSASPARTKTWTLRMEVVEEDDDVTMVDAALDTGDRTLTTRSSAHRNPHDPPMPSIGDEYAAGRALLDLGKQLLREGTTDAAANDKHEKG